MYKAPSQRRHKKVSNRLNLIPILDAVFIFIFFLLMSANFIKIFEVPSDVPIVSSQPPPKNQKPLALTMTIEPNSLVLASGVPSRTIKTIRKTADGEYDFEMLHNYLIEVKRKHLKENSIVFEPVANITYQELIKLMDTVRMFRATDPAYYKKEASGLETKIKNLFDNIIIGNIRS